MLRFFGWCKSGGDSVMVFYYEVRLSECAFCRNLPNLTWMFTIVPDCLHQPICSYVRNAVSTQTNTLSIGALGFPVSSVPYAENAG